MPPPNFLEAEFDSYRITGVIGSGTLGTVYEAQQVRLNRRVAVKFLSTEVAADFSPMEFQEEAIGLAALFHPNIAMLIDAGTVRGQSFLVTELVSGLSLHEYIDSGESDLVATVGIGSQICDGLSFAHAHDILHLDLNPNHVLISEIGWVKLVDFRMSRPFAPGKTGSRRALPYLCPEELGEEDEGMIDYRADVYSVGKILWHMISGQAPPVHGSGELDLGEVPTAWKDVIGKAVRRAPEERFADCRELQAALMSID